MEQTKEGPGTHQCPLLAMMNGAAQGGREGDQQGPGRGEQYDGIARQLKRIADALEKMIMTNGTELKAAYSVKETAELLGKSESTIRRWIREGKLQSAKTSDSVQGQHLIPRHSVEELMTRW